ncbi:MAG: hypothetical protein M1441_00630 [Candidatus Parvarchaeota archaeon]|jgi:uncharacterized membrane protein|nr:hypothetical protein [Candidatus Parvarchaeota archaeon]
MDKKASVQWRLIWLVIVIITFIVALALIAVLYYASAHGTSPFNYFQGLLG